MDGKCWRGCTLAALFLLAVLSSTRAEEDPKPIDGGKAEKFKGKAFELKEKGKAKIILAFPAGKKVKLTIKSTKESDINLFVYDEDKKVVYKDDSPGPSCELTFTPKEDVKYTLEIVNLGPGANKSTLKVAFEKKKE